MAGNALRVGVLALQGDVREHLAVLRALGADAHPVRRLEELSAVEGLVLPGGESSVIDKLARAFGLFDPIRAAIADGMPMYGTCAGLILLADRIDGAITGQRTFGGIDARVARNAFGSQTASFETDLDVPALGEPPVHAAFIRAPAVVEWGPDAVPLASLSDGRVVAIEQGALLGTAFHPESTGETRFHDRFLSRVHSRRGISAPAL
ncbi:pyridoxal 5'-phosphate synthase glutaminase subunit PdxT [Microbacterium testaceum]|uniref:Pyridoxal 5'-phosphate synthase subunit PdxT n=1 Tax=Microbacterium testaceum TaxID=2033 RepID=A0A2T7WFF9_MICTE|nr:pyridoxal 5'-phosphate synthase glutaminase subunit PdxT [Microbacterium testaceum]PVE69735.1 pyridoxal 5'-phosphate synthase glutaminase subunit PdxT [Microbacterium testaceum]